MAKHLTGFDEEVQLGQLGEILENDSVVMTVELSDKEGSGSTPAMSSSGGASRCTGTKVADGTARPREHSRSSASKQDSRMSGSHPSENQARADRFAGALRPASHPSSILGPALSSRLDDQRRHPLSARSRER